MAYNVGRGGGGGFGPGYGIGLGSSGDASSAEESEDGASWCSPCKLPPVPATPTEIEVLAEEPQRNTRFFQRNAVHTAQTAPFCPPAASSADPSPVGARFLAVVFSMRIFCLPAENTGSPTGRGGRRYRAKNTCRLERQVYQLIRLVPSSTLVEVGLPAEIAGTLGTRLKTSRWRCSHDHPYLNFGGFVFVDPVGMGFRSRFRSFSSLNSVSRGTFWVLQKLELDGIGSSAQHCPS
ncbi:hypothetical protein T492DRAFT_832061 [Pavlovales sp. CCMP2436]|nr:hypothetical protein T492DRAFT_832061 [Pavlovales sp. CCMP2436]